MRRLLVTFLGLGLAVWSFGCGRFEKKREVTPEKRAGALTDPSSAGKSACSVTGSSSTDSAATQLSHFRLDNIPICSIESRSIAVADEAVILGKDLSSRMLLASESQGWPTLEETTTMVASQRLIGPGYVLRHVSNCWYLEGESHLYQAIDMSFVSMYDSVRVIASGEQVFASGSGSFDAVASMNIAMEGDAAGSRLVEAEVDGSGYLQNAMFQVILPADLKRATSTKNEFVYSQDDGRFFEASAFGHANETLAWYQGLNPATVDTDCFPMDINMHVVLPPSQGGKNNARYDPDTVSQSGRPTILLGDGDGLNLKNVGRDPDVLMHEFAHHVIYRSVKDSLDFQSRAIHEGLADYLVAAKTGNACLGETICPPGSSMCATSSCLRTADNDLTFADNVTSLYDTAQVISGMLWRLQIDFYGSSASDPSGTLLAKIVVTAIGYLPSRSTFRDLIVALMIADRDLNAGAHVCHIVEVATQRGLGDELTDLDCEQYR